MTTDTAKRLGTVAWIVAAVVVLVGISLEIAYRVQASDPVLSLADSLWTFIPVPFAVLGAVIVSRQHGNRIGWLLLAIGAAMTLSNLGDAVFFFIDEPPAALSPMLFVVLWYNNVAWTTFFFPMFMLLYVFPTGRLLTRRWVWAPRLAVVLFGYIAIASLIADEIGPTSEAWVTENPVGFVDSATIESSLLVFLIGVLALLVGGIVAMVMRYRRASGVEREQIKWVLFGFFVFVAAWVTAFLLESWGSGIVGLLLVLGISVIPAVITIAVLKYRLYDIDVVISRTVTYGVLGVFVTAVYAFIVVGIGSLLDGGDGSNLALSIAAVAVVAVAFEPLRRRVQHWANVLVYGRRATPYEVLASATARLSDTSDPDEVLGQVTQLVIDGTGAIQAVVWLTVGDTMQPTSSTPPSAVEALSPVAATSAGTEGIPGDSVAAVRHRGEVLGALSITKRPGDSVTTADRKVLDDVAAGAATLLRNIGLHAELAERAEQLRVSRRRLVAAQDAERHRLERDLHDGAQQQVVALKVKLGIARTLAEREGAEPVAAMVSSLAETTQAAVDSMRAVAHGIYPPLLEAEGLGTALAAATRTIPIPVEVVATGIGRYDRTVEESVYFAVSGIVNRALDAGATRAIVVVEEEGTELGFSVHVDAHPGDLVAVDDRIDALGGTLGVTPDQGRYIVSGMVSMTPATMVEAR